MADNNLQNDRITQFQELINKYRDLAQKRKDAVESLEGESEVKAAEISKGISDYQQAAKDSALSQGLMSAAFRAGSLGDFNEAPLQQSLEADKYSLDKQVNDYNQAESRLNKAQGFSDKTQKEYSSLIEAQPEIESKYKAEEFLDKPLDQSLINVLNEKLKLGKVNVTLPNTLTNRQLQDNKVLNQVVTTALGGGRDRNLISTVVTASDGSSELVLMNPITGAEVKRVGKAPDAYTQGNIKGIVQGEKIMTSLPAESELAYTKAQKREEGKDQGKDIVASEKADIKADQFYKFKDRVKALRKKALGNIPGPIGQFQPSFTMGKDQIEYQAFLNKNIATTMKEISGATISDKEVERLTAFLPAYGDTEAQTEDKLNSMEQEVRKIAAEQRLAAGRTNPTPAETQPAQPVQPTQAPTKKRKVNIEDL